VATIALERVAPLLVGALAAIGVGFGASAMFATVPLWHSLVAPGVATTS
jgi:hypothetical protein